MTVHDLPEGLRYDRATHTIIDAQDHPWVSIHESGLGDPESWRETIIARVCDALCDPDWNGADEIDHAFVAKIAKQDADDEKGAPA